MATDFPDCLKEFATEFDREFGRLLQPPEDVPPILAEAMRYSALSPGKRIRPYLVARCCELAGGSRSGVWYVGAAVECVHAFSLIHDDLPAMDDDDLRRGRPTCHRKFGEAIAILAGDALMMLAFELLARHCPDPVRLPKLVLSLAKGGGWSGMIGGQAADVLGENEPPSIERARYIHERKTAALFEASCAMGVIASGGTDEVLSALTAYGKHLGQAFQITDDLLDVTSTSQLMGKRVGKDVSAGKQTFPECVGMERSRAAARESASEAFARLAPFGEDADDLRSLANYVVDRNY
jgi:geranylgeranyl diphosphate synthase type II